MARALGKNFAELQQSYKNNIKAETEEVKKIETTPADLIDILRQTDFMGSFESELDRVIVKISSLQSEDGIMHPATQEFLAKIGPFTKDKLNLSFLGFFSELCE